MRLIRKNKLCWNRCENIYSTQFKKHSKWELIRRNVCIRSYFNAFAIRIWWVFSVCVWVMMMMMKVRMNLQSEWLMLGLCLCLCVWRRSEVPSHFTPHTTHTHGRNVFLIPFRLQSPPLNNFSPSVYSVQNLDNHLSNTRQARRRSPWIRSNHLDGTVQIATSFTARTT